MCLCVFFIIKQNAPKCGTNHKSKVLLKPKNIESHRRALNFWTSLPLKKKKSVQNQFCAIFKHICIIPVHYVHLKWQKCPAILMIPTTQLLW